MSHGKNVRQQPANSVPNPVQQHPVKPPRSKSRRRHFSYAKDSAGPPSRANKEATLLEGGGDRQVEGNGGVKQRAIFGCMAGIDELVEGTACGNNHAQGEGLVWIEGRMRTLIKSVAVDEDEDDSKLCCQAEAIQPMCNVEAAYVVEPPCDVAAEDDVIEQKIETSKGRPNGRLRRSSSVPAPGAAPPARASSAKPTLKSRCGLSGAGQKPARKYSYSKPALAESMGGCLPRNRRRGHSGKPRRAMSAVPISSSMSTAGHCPTRISAGAPTRK